MRNIVKTFEEYGNVRTIKFEHTRNPRLNLEVDVQPDGRIVEIRNPQNVRFPFKVGQILNRNHETWAANNNYLVNGKNTGPEPKIFGMRTKDIPPGDPLRIMYPGKFRK